MANRQPRRPGVMAPENNEPAQKIKIGRVHPAELARAKSTPAANVQEQTTVQQEIKNSLTGARAAHTSTTAAALEIDEEEIRRIEEEEKREAAAAREKREVKMVTGDLHWKQYLEPENKTCLQECQSIDRYNNSVFVYNNAMAPRINALLNEIGGCRNVEVRRPVDYYGDAKKQWDKKLWDPDFRMLKAVQWLYAKTGQCAVKDYKLTEGPDIADQAAFEQEKARWIEKYKAEGALGINITCAVHDSHRNNCTCDNHWDGVSERCIGGAARIRWIRLKGHHFLRPSISMEQW